MRVEPDKPVIRYLYARADVDRFGGVTFLPLAIVTTTDDLRLDRTGEGEPYTFALTDGDGQQVAEAVVDLQPPACSMDGQASSVISAFLPIPPATPGWRLTLSRANEEVASQALDAPAPSVALENVPPPGKTASGRHDVAWSSASADGSVVGHSVWFSSDEGLTWWPLALGFEGTALSVDFDELPGGEAAQLRVTAVSGAAESEVRSDPFVVHPPVARVMIEELDEPAPPAPGEPVHVRASGWKAPDGPITDPDAFRWSSDLDGDLGPGLERNVVLERPGKHALTVVLTAPDGSTATATQTISVTRTAQRFLHVAGKSSGKDNSTVLEHPSLNGRPDAIVLVTPIWNPGGGAGVYNDHAVGAWYDGAAWRIFNQDLAPMPEGAAFVVDVLEPSPTAFVHVGEPSGNSTYVSHPFADGRPDALLFVTANWNPGGGAGTYDPEPLGAWFDLDVKRWAVFNQTGRAMPAGVGFNIEVVAAGGSAFTHVAVDENISGNSTRLSHPALDKTPGALLQVSPTWNPPSSGGVYVPHHLGVWYDGQHWNVFTQDQQPMPTGAAFAVSP